MQRRQQVVAGILIPVEAEVGPAREVCPKAGIQHRIARHSKAAPEKGA